MRIRVVTPWYPDNYSRYSGIFVKKQVDALRSVGHEVEVEIPSIFPAPQGEVPGAVMSALDSLASQDPGRAFEELEDGVKVPAPVPAQSGDLGRALAFEASLAIRRKYTGFVSDVVHAHLGVPTGLASLRLGDSPLIVTEHQSTLNRVFSQAGGVAAYREVIEHSQAFLCVSEHLRELILTAVGRDLEESIRVVPNIVDLADVEFRARKAPFGHWIYVGTLAQHKGVELLLKSFKTFKRHKPDAQMTLVGEGPHRPWIERFVAGAGLGAAVRLVGSVPHENLGRLLGQADLMVHLSPSETFGVASLEGIGAGLPVISLRNGGAASAWGEIEQLVGKLLPLEASHDDVARAAIELCTDDVRLDLRLGRRFVEERYSPRSVTSTLQDIYASALP